MPLTQVDQNTLHGVSLNNKPLKSEGASIKTPQKDVHRSLVFRPAAAISPDTPIEGDSTETEGGILSDVSVSGYIDGGSTARAIFGPATLASCDAASAHGNESATMIGAADDTVEQSTLEPAQSMDIIISPIARRRCRPQTSAELVLSPKPLQTSSSQLEMVENPKQYRPSTSLHAVFFALGLLALGGFVGLEQQFAWMHDELDVPPPTALGQSKRATIVRSGRTGATISAEGTTLDDQLLATAHEFPASPGTDPLAAAGLQLWVRGPFVEEGANAPPTMVFDAHIDMQGLPRLHPKHSRLCLTVASVSPGEARALTNRGHQQKQQGAGKRGKNELPKGSYAMQCLEGSDTFAAAMAAGKRTQVERELIAEVQQAREEWQRDGQGVLDADMDDSAGEDAAQEVSWLSLLPGAEAILDMDEAAAGGIEAGGESTCSGADVCSSGDSGDAVGRAITLKQSLGSAQAELDELPPSEACAVDMRIGGLAPGEYAATAMVMDSRGRKHKRTVVFEAALPKTRGKRKHAQPSVAVGGGPGPHDSGGSGDPELSITVDGSGCRVMQG